MARTAKKEAGGRSIWIIGAGRFGMMAAAKLAAAQTAHLTVIDRNPQALQRLRLPGAATCRADGIDYLAGYLRLAPRFSPGKAEDTRVSGQSAPERSTRAGEEDSRALPAIAARPDWIVPAIPTHVAAELVKRGLGMAADVSPMDMPPEIREQLPHPANGPPGRIYVSIADFICPDDCPEPADRCFHTGKPREWNLYDRLQSIRTGGMRRIVLRSRQLAPGVGGYTPAALRKILQEAASGANAKIMLATACRCHGVIDTFTARKA